MLLDIDNYGQLLLLEEGRVEVLGPIIMNQSKIMEIVIKVSGFLVNNGLTPSQAAPASCIYG